VRALLPTSCTGRLLGQVPRGEEKRQSRVLRQAVAFLSLVVAVARATEGIADDQSERAQTFPIAMRGNPVFLPVQIDSKQYRFLFDTGSAVTVLDTSLAHLLGKRTSSLPVYTTMEKDPVDMPLYVAPRVVLASNPLSGISHVFCVDFRKKQFLLDGRAPDGFLGMDALRGIIIRLDCDRGELSVLRSVPKRAGTAVPLVLDHGVPHARLRFAGHSPAYFCVDTGAIWLTSGDIGSRLLRSLVDSGEARVVGESPQTTLHASSIAREGRVGQLSLAGFAHHDLLFSEGSRNAISLNYLSRYIVIFDFPRMTMYLTPGARFAEPDRADLSGLHWRRDGNWRLVKDIVDGGPAATAGLREGDLLVEFDGVPAEQLTNLDLHRLLATPSTQWLTIRRGDAMLRIKLELREESPPEPTNAYNDREASPK
jgi:hypothetical protein